MKCLFIILLILLLSASAAGGQVTITTAGGSAPAVTTLDGIVIPETLVNNIAQSQSYTELIITAPPSLWFNPSVGIVNNTPGDDNKFISETFKLIMAPECAGYKK